MWPASMSEGPGMFFLILFSESLQVGLEGRDLLFQRGEILLHLVKLNEETCFYSWCVFKPC